MDLETLKARKLELDQAKTNMVNSFNIITGHIAECDYQISLIETENSKVVEEPIAESEVVAVE